MPSRTEAIQRFLQSKTHSDLANLYNYNMEVQVNVAQDDGEIIEGEFAGRRWRGYTNGLETWKPIRIPWKANTEPEYNDSEMKFNLEAHVEAIGMTGWDWNNQCSKWVAYDFDSLTNHADGLTHVELEDIITAVENVEWVTIRKSTSGSGLHLYVFLPDVKTNNHTEHAALARAFLGKLSAITAFPFESKVDICGSNMWVWHRKMRNTDGLTLVKSGRSILESEIPVNWRDHLTVIKNKRSRNITNDKVSTKDGIEKVASQRPHEPLEDEHKRLIDYLESEDAFWWWDQDKHMLVTHTYWLKKAHTDLDLEGIFETISGGTNIREQNCFLFPLRGGAWSVRRYTPGVQEHSTWDQDGQGWTRCYFNRAPDLQAAASMFGAVESKKGKYTFLEAEMAIKAAELLGTFIQIPDGMRSREMTIAPHNDGKRIEVEIKREPTDMPVPGWSAEAKTWYKAFNTNTPPTVRESEVADFDDMLRHLVSITNVDLGWMIFTDNEWRIEPKDHCKAALKACGYKPAEIEVITGAAVLRPWKKVNKPLQPEYPGAREWNRNSAQLSFAPNYDSEDLNFTTWRKMLDHCGKGLDDAIEHSAWAKANGLKTGGDYLKVWIAALLQYPTEPLPYLFFHGDQDVGKSIFHEALTELLTRGVKRADAALVSQSNFNAELEEAIICVVEETDLERNKSAYNKIKDWVTSREIMIHRKGETPYQVPNTTHWIQCSNNRLACPVFPGDTRITMLWVEPINPLEKIPKRDFINQLRKEAPDFLASVLQLEVPDSNDRLMVPIIETGDKLSASEQNMSPVQRFIRDCCYYIPGHQIKYGDLYNRFVEYCEPHEAAEWTKQRFGQNLPPQYPKGKDTKQNGQWYVGNVSYVERDPAEPELPKLITIGDRLVSQVER